MNALPSYFLSHGGGPWPFMMDQVGHLYGQLDASLRDIPRPARRDAEGGAGDYGALGRVAISWCRRRRGRR